MKTPGAANRRRQPPRKLFNKGLFQKMCTVHGKTHSISKTAFETISAMGDDFLKKLVRKSRLLIQSQPAFSDGKKNTTLSPRHLIAAANALKVPGEVTEDAVERAVRQAYDATSFKKSAIRSRLAANSKFRIKKDSNKYLWCIVLTLLEEIIQQAIETKADDKARITTRAVFNAINTHPENLLSPLKSYVAEGINFAV